MEFSQVAQVLRQQRAFPQSSACSQSTPVSLSIAPFHQPPPDRGDPSNRSDRSLKPTIEISRPDR